MKKINKDNKQIVTNCVQQQLRDSSRFIRSNGSFTENKSVLSTTKSLNLNCIIFREVNKFNCNLGSINKKTTKRN